jgi:hypothetical protein
MRTSLSISLPTSKQTTKKSGKNFDFEEKNVNAFAKLGGLNCS